MRELDVLLTRFLDAHYESSREADKAAFRQLLQLSDPELARYLLSGDASDDQGLARIIERVRGGAPS